MRGIDLIWSPSREFEQISKSRDWLPYLLVLAVGYWALAYWMEPFMKRANEVQLSQFLEPEELNELHAEATPWKIAGLIATPSILLFKASFYSLIAISLLALSGKVLEFKKGLTVLLAASSIFLLEGMVTMIILRLRGLEGIRDPSDLSPPLGLDLFFYSSSSFVNSILGNLNLFEAWYFLLLVLGLSTVGAFSRRESARVAGVLWCIGVVAEARLQSFLDGLNQAFK